MFYAIAIAILLAFVIGHVVGAARAKSQLSRPVGGGGISSNGGIAPSGTGRPAPRTGDDGTRAS